MASPASLERAVTVVKEYFRRNPEAKSFSLCLNDGSWSCCECEYCRAADGMNDPIFDTIPYHVTGGVSARYYKFLWHVGDAIQDEFPGRKVTAFVYAGNDLPPADLRPNPNVVVQVVGTKTPWVNPEFRKWEELRYRRWARLTPNLASYDYMYQEGYIPIYTPHTHAEAVRFLHRAGYTMSYAETFQTMSRSGPRYWVNLKLCNDPDSDVDALLDRWIRGMFKEAAAPMTDYYNAIEQAWTNYPYHERHTDAWSTYCFTHEAPLPLITPEIMARLDNDLAEAEKLARDPKVKGRLALIRASQVTTRERAKIIWRQRPYIDPVPFDDASVLEDLSEHARNQAPFDAEAYELANCASNKITLNFCNGRMPPIDTPAKRLGRVIDGIVDKSLREALAKPAFSQADIQKAVAGRVEEFAAKARIAPERKATLAKLTDRLVGVKRVAVGPQLDGKGDDACWQGVAEYRSFIPASGSNGLAFAETSKYATSFKVLHDDQAFYFAVACRQDPASIVANAQERADKSAIEKDDRVSITLEPWQYRFRNTSGRVTVTATAGGLAVDKSDAYGVKYWNAGSRAVSRRTPDGYFLEVEVPFKSCLYSADRGPRLLFNVQRFVQGTAPEESAWYPAALGDAFACVEMGNNSRLVRDFDRPTMTPLNTGAVNLTIDRKGWESYVLKVPSVVTWPAKSGLPVRVMGESVLTSEAFLDVQSGHVYEVEADYKGSGACVPSVNWYRRTEVGYDDVMAGVKFGETRVEKASVKTARVLATAPANADAARLRLTCSGDVQVVATRLIPRLPLEVRLDLDTDVDYLAIGHVLTVQATIRNVSDKPIEGLTARMGYPAGVDLRSQAVSALASLKPGESTRALWWLTPVYAAGKKDFVAVVVVEAAKMTRIVAKAKGPLSPNR
ncbi:MAG: DUF4838 domain-containing protein [Kiritimatiellae bacterium]|nr:DUF4838 domain-containing protein [Kiritimatiellia bacterium]